MLQALMLWLYRFGRHVPVKKTNLPHDWALADWAEHITGGIVGEARKTQDDVSIVVWTLSRELPSDYCDNPADYAALLVGVRRAVRGVEVVDHLSALTSYRDDSSGPLLAYVTIWPDITDDTKLIATFHLRAPVRHTVSNT